LVHPVKEMEVGEGAKHNFWSEEGIKIMALAPYKDCTLKWDMVALKVLKEII
jgi:hypothetical protein